MADVAILAGIVIGWILAGIVIGFTVAFLWWWMDDNDTWRGGT